MLSALKFSSLLKIEQSGTKTPEWSSQVDNAYTPVAQMETLITIRTSIPKPLLIIFPLKFRSTVYRRNKILPQSDFIFPFHFINEP